MIDIYITENKEKYILNDVTEIIYALEESLSIIKNLISRKKVKNLDESISYYEKLLKKHNIN